MTDSLRFASLPRSTRLAIAWGFFWRGILITVASGVAGGVIGAVLGFLAALAGLQPDTSAFKALPVVGGGIVGLAFFYLYVQWLFGAKLSGFKLQLIRQ
jgi:ABC-type amino acid transport system permease subunit